MHATKPLVFAGALLAVMAAAVGESSPQPIALWPAGVAIARPETSKAETAVAVAGPVAGRPWTSVANVSQPTMTIHPARGRNSGAALVVFPGGGYQILAIDLEGSEICDWATAVGITCVVLKYRVPQTWWPKDCDCQRQPQPFLPLQDAQRTIALLRARAGDLAIDPHKIGVIGFSAGGHLVTAVSNAAGLSYAPVDAADRQSVRPDFAIALYPGHLWSGKDLNLFDFDPVRPSAPPTLLVQAEDDPVDDVRNSIAYDLALRQAGVPVELHLYAHGGHAFGARPTEQPITHWPDLAVRWLHSIGML